MRFANDILELNTWWMNFGREPRGQLSGMKKLLAKGENGKFWASDFGIRGHEMVGLAYLSIVKPTGVTKEVTITLMRWSWDTMGYVPYTKKVTVKEWELLDYERLAKAYELIMALIKL